MRGVTGRPLPARRSALPSGGGQDGQRQCHVTTIYQHATPDKILEVVEVGA